ncbi:hypothetical protein CRV24_004853 [Beauveria bassiana]|nr:hypothetical protein CRV24_004853 [Beauveria bassiana]
MTCAAFGIPKIFNAKSLRIVQVGGFRPPRRLRVLVVHDHAPHVKNAVKTHLCPCTLAVDPLKCNRYRLWLHRAGSSPIVLRFRGSGSGGGGGTLALQATVGRARVAQHVDEPVRGHVALSRVSHRGLYGADGVRLGFDGFLLDRARHGRGQYSRRNGVVSFVEEGLGDGRAGGALNQRAFLDGVEDDDGERRRAARSPAQINQVVVGVTGGGALADRSVVAPSGHAVFERPQRRIPVADVRLCAVLEDEVARAAGHGGLALLRGQALDEQAIVRVVATRGSRRVEEEELVEHGVDGLLSEPRGAEPRDLLAQKRREGLAHAKGLVGGRPGGNNADAATRARVREEAEVKHGGLDLQPGVVALHELQEMEPGARVGVEAALAHLDEHLVEEARVVHLHVAVEQDVEGVRVERYAPSLGLGEQALGGGAVAAVRGHELQRHLEDWRGDAAARGGILKSLHNHADADFVGVNAVVATVYDGPDKGVKGRLGPPRRPRQLFVRAVDPVLLLPMEPYFIQLVRRHKCAPVLGVLDRGPQTPRRVVQGRHLAEPVHLDVFTHGDELVGRLREHGRASAQHDCRGAIAVACHAQPRREPRARCNVVDALAAPHDIERPRLGQHDAHGVHGGRAASDVRLCRVLEQSQGVEGVAAANPAGPGRERLLADTDACNEPRALQAQSGGLGGGVLPRGRDVRGAEHLGHGGFGLGRLVSVRVANLPVTGQVRLGYLADLCGFLDSSVFGVGLDGCVARGGGGRGGGAQVQRALV